MAAEVDPRADDIIQQQIVKLGDVMNALDGLTVKGDPTRGWIGNAEKHIIEALKDLRGLRDGHHERQDEKRRYWQEQGSVIRRMWERSGYQSIKNQKPVLIAVAGLCVHCKQDNNDRYHELQMPLCEKCEKRFERNKAGSSVECKEQVARFLERF